MKKETQKHISLVLVVAMLMMLLPSGLSLPISASTGTITSIIRNPNYPTTGANPAPSLAPIPVDNGNFVFRDRYTMTFARMGKKLKGLTQIITSTYDSTRSSDSNIKSFMSGNEEYFNFTADSPGAVYVISTKDLHSSGNKNYASWTLLANDASPSLPPNTFYATPFPSPPVTSPTLAPYTYNWGTVPLDWEPPTEDYYLARIQWNNEAYCIVTSSPKTAGLTAQNDSQAHDITMGYMPKNTSFPANDPIRMASTGSDFKYAYRKYFAANTPVSVPVHGISMGDNYVVLVNWDDTEPDNAMLSDLTYTVPGSAAATVTGFTPSDEGGTYSVELPKGTESVTANAVRVNQTTSSIVEDPSGGVVNLVGGIGSYSITVNSGTLPSQTYTVNFTVVQYYDNSKLSSLTYTADNGAPADVTGFLPADEGGEYHVTVPEGTRTASLSAVASDIAGAAITYDKPILDKLPGAITATVTSDAGNKSYYKVIFDLPGYVLQDSFDGHGNIGDLVANKLGSWTSASTSKETDGSMKEWITVGTDPFDSTNLVAAYNANGLHSNFPAFKKNVSFSSATGPVAISADFLVTEASGVGPYVELRKAADSSNGTQVFNMTSGGIISLGKDDTLPYKWAPGKWMKLTLVISPDPSPDPTASPLPLTNNCPIRAILSGEGITDAQGNPATIDVTKTWNLTAKEYYDSGNLQFVFNSGFATGKTTGLYVDNARVYYPAAGIASIVNNTGTSVTRSAEVLLSKYEFNPASFKPENISVTSGGNPVEVSAVNYNPLRPDKFSLEFYQTLAENAIYNLNLNNVTDVAGNPITGSFTFTTGTAVPITGISINSAGNLTQSYGATKKVIFTANTEPYDNVDISKVAWLLNGQPAGTGRTFEFTPDEIGDYIVSASVNGTQLSADPVTVTVGKGTRTAPTPEITKDAVSITVTSIDEAQYGILPKGSTDAVAYGSSNEFTALTPGTQYTVYVRMAETDYYIASDPITTDITTDAAAFGDINADGAINISDVIMAAEIAVGYPNYTVEQIIRANVSDKVDKTVDISDVVMIAERAVGGTALFPVDQN